MIRVVKGDSVMELLDEHQLAAYENVGWKRVVEKKAAEGEIPKPPEKRRGRKPKNEV